MTASSSADASKAAAILARMMDQALGRYLRGETTDTQYHTAVATCRRLLAVPPPAAPTSEP